MGLALYNNTTYSGCGAWPCVFRKWEHRKTSENVVKKKEHNTFRSTNMTPAYQHTQAVHLLSTKCTMEGLPNPAIFIYNMPHDSPHFSSLSH
jgi:hypothetical protein